MKGFTRKSVNGFTRKTVKGYYKNNCEWVYGNFKFIFLSIFIIVIFRFGKYICPKIVQDTLEVDNTREDITENKMDTTSEDTMENKEDNVSFF